MVDVVVKGGKRFKKNPSGKLKQLCIVNDCEAQIQWGKTGHYCRKHYMELDESEDERRKIVGEVKRENLVKKIANKKKIRKTSKKRVRHDGEIIIQNGKRYKKFPDGKLKQLCLVENCNKQIQWGSGGHYCREHFLQLGKTKEERQKSINQNKIEVKQKIKDDRYTHVKTIKQIKQTINNREIYFYKGKKYRCNDKNKFIRICMYDGCATDAQINNGTYCKLHKNGLSPDAVERLEEKKIIIDRFKEIGKSVMRVGINTEKWIYEIMHIFTSINSIKLIGYTGNKLDVIYKVNGEDKFRGIQIKTLVKTKNNDTFSLKLHSHKYDDNTLIVGINKEKNKFALFFVKEISSSCPTFSFNKKEPKYKNFMFKSMSKFLLILESKLCQSCIYNVNDISIDMLKEINSINRLNKKCKFNKLELKKLDDPISAIDCVINNYNIQCKTTNVNERGMNIYKFNIQKNAGKNNGKRKFQPYSDKDDIDFFVFEIAKYPNYFYIIPIQEMIKNGLIKIDTQSGKRNFCLPSPTSEKPHWSKPYLNNFDQLKVNEFWEKIQKT